MTSAMEKNYKKFENVSQNKKNIYNTKTILYLLILTICLILVCVSIWANDPTETETVIVLLKQDQLSIKTVSDKFLSFGLDTSLLRQMKNLPINHEKFINLARHLSPAYVRLGGTDSDCLFFNHTLTQPNEINKQNVNMRQLSDIDSHDISNFTITSKDFVSLYEFSRRAKIKMIFDLNVLLRNSDGSWNDENAKDIILFAKVHEMELDWQLGNEPNSFYHVFKMKISPIQLAKDYCKLRTILNNLGYEQSLLLGPETNHIGDEFHNGEIYLKTFLENVNDCIDDVTWHQYYLNGHIAQVQDFVNSTIFNRLPKQIHIISDIIQSSTQNVSIWLSETSSAYGGGAPKLSDKFVAGFLWLDKLGYSAKTGIQVVIRQSLFNGYYAMIGPDLNPNPDWWVSVIFKQFVSEKVLNLVTPNNFGNIRLYAHCTSKQVLLNKNSTAVIYGVNLNDVEQQIYIEGLPSGSKFLIYILTSDNLQSRTIFMNGKILKLQNNGNLPVFNPKIITTNQPILLPPYSMVFLLISGMEVQSCLT